MKANSAIPFASESKSSSQKIRPTFSHRMARPSISRTVSSLNDALRIDDLWDFSLVDRLHGPITRRHY